MRTLRAAAEKAVEVNGRVSVFATVPANHVKMVSASEDVIAQAVDQVAAQAR
jgi:hypothetical protein